MAEKNKKICLLLAIFVFVFFGFGQICPVFAASNPLVQEIGELDKQIDAKKKEIEALQKKSNTYKSNIETIKKKVLSLETELAILSNKIAKIEVDVELTQKNIETITLEIKDLDLKIKEKEENIAQNKTRMAEILRLINRGDDVNYLKILAVDQSFSEIFDQLEYTKELQANLQNVLDKIKSEKSELVKRGEEKTSKKKEEEKNKDDLLKLQASLREQSTSKEILLSQSAASERQFQNWLLEAKYEEEQINANIYLLEKNIRKKLEESDKIFSGGQSGSIALSWPVDPSRGLTATFHDSDYPFRYIFEHPAIDIRVAQGTSVAAAAPGYVAKVQKGGVGGYSYVMLIHNNNISTVYGHLSKINVQEDTYVIRGQIIGLSGGMPGTPGAGKLTTGPHLHFETRADGLPVNPLDYLP